MAQLYYLAYGSNLLPRRLQERTPSAQPFAPVALRGWHLAFHKRGRDGSGKCDLVYGRDPAHAAYGIVYRVAREQRPALDAAEGPDYRVAWLELEVAGSMLQVFTYLARPAAVDPRLKPFCWYRGLVLAGAREHRFPEHYIATIERITAVRDPCDERHRLHQALVDAAPPADRTAGRADRRRVTARPNHP